MDYTILEVFRHDLYHECFKRAADALFDLADALLTDSSARSLVELSQASSYRRRWSSLYQALEDGQIDRPHLIRLFARMLPKRLVGTRLVLGLDTSAILRPSARTSPDRSLVYRSNLPSDATPVGAGWQFSSLVVLPDPCSSWMYTLDNRRVPSSETATTIGLAQLRELLPQLRRYQAPILLLLDRRYSNAPWVSASNDLPTQQLIRARRDQVLYRAKPAPSGKRGRPRLDGERFKGSDPSTHASADEEWQGLDQEGREVQVTVWDKLHLRKARSVEMAVIRVVRASATGTKRDPREAWFWWLGGSWPPLWEIPQLYGRRYGQEHGYRFDKQELLWAKPRVRTPEQMQRWTDIVASVRNQVVLARTRVAGERRAWERARREVTPSQVRRALGRIIAQVGTPAKAPLPRGKSPGRAVGARVKPAERHVVVRKSPPKPKRRPKRC
jgi:hypothetical protein